MVDLTSADNQVASRPDRRLPSTELRGNSSQVEMGQGRQILALLAASGVVIAAWAVFPSFVESRKYVPLPQASDSVASDAIDDPGQGVFQGFAAKAAVFKTMSASGQTTDVRIGLESSNRVVVVQQVPVRSKLQALLLLLVQSDDIERPALEAKIRALLELPDLALAELVRHPDLAELSAMLDSVFLGTSDVSHVKAELDKISVTSVPSASERIQVIAVSGKPAYEVRTPVKAELVAAAAAPLASSFDETSPGTVVTTLAQEPSIAPLPPSEPPPTPMFEQARFVAPALELAPSIDEAPPPAPPPPPPPPPPAPEPTEQPSANVMDSGNKFEPGETAAQGAMSNSPTTEAPPSQTSSPQPPEPPEPPAPPAVADGNAAAGDGGNTSPNEGGSGGGSGQ